MRGAGRATPAVSDEIPVMWTLQEDDYLCALLTQQSDCTGWGDIAAQLRKTAEECRQRADVLADQTPFEAWEDKLITAANHPTSAQREQWDLIASLLNNRTAFAVRNRWNSTLNMPPASEELASAFAASGFAPPRARYEALRTSARVLHALSNTTISNSRGENAMELSRAIRYLIYMLLKALPLGEPGPRAGTRQKSSRRDDTAPSRNTRARAEPTDWLCEAARLASQDPGTCPGCTDAELQPCDGRDPDSPGPSACLVMTGEVEYNMFLADTDIPGVQQPTGPSSYPDGFAERH